MDTTLIMALFMGLAGSLHCAGMCGPIVWIMPFQLLNGYKKWAGILLYHLGRITTYTLLAFTLYSFRSLFHPQVQQYISIILGVSLLVMGVISFVPNNKLKFTLPWAEYIKRQLGNFIGRPGAGALFATGFLNGLLPCGLVYMALAAAVTTKSAPQAMLFMYAFGLGTMPMLISITLLKTRNFLPRFHQVKKMVPVIMFAFGCLFVLRGMNLGIPYVSPKIVISQHGIKACCCHKN